MANTHVKRRDSIGSAGSLAALSSTPSPLTTPRLAPPLCAHLPPPLTANGHYRCKPTATLNHARWPSKVSERTASQSAQATPTSGCSLASRPSGCMGSATTSSTRVSLNSKVNQRPLATKHIYLDLTPAAHKCMEAKLYILGANIEKCLSREANYMITDQGHPRDYKSSGNHGNNNKNTSSSSNIVTRGCNGSARRPLKCISQSPSPNIPVTPSQSPQASVISPLSRGQAIANLVNTAKYHSGGNAVINAQRLGIKIIHYDSAMVYVKKELDKLSRIPNTVNSQPNSKQNHVTAKKLPSPVCKITSKHYQPIIISAKYFTSSNKSYNRTISKHKSKQGKVMNNYCELCNDEFTILSKHLKGQQHNSKVNQANHFTALDSALASCGTLSDLLTSLS